MKAKLNDVLFLNISQNCIQILSDCIYNYPVLCFVTTKPSSTYCDIGLTGSCSVWSICTADQTTT